MTSRSALRERQLAVVREAILDALANRLEREEPEEIALAQLAADAGVSLRTLYRYFPTRDELFAEVGDHIVLRLGLPAEIPGPEQISAVFLESARRGAQHPQLTRAMLHSSLGRRARSAHRSRRVQAVRDALGGVTSHLDPAEARRRTGAISYLCSLAAWVTVCEETGMPAPDAQRGIAWALDTLIAALRRENAANTESQGSTR